MRYLPQAKKSREEMLSVIGINSIEDLYKDVPKNEMGHDFALPDHQGELAVERHMGSYANQNHAAPDGPFFLGAGVYYHHVPASVDYIIQRSEFLTAYTPYQPEIAQGTLQALFEFQSFIALLTGQEVANASLYDGATALAEAALMAQRVTKRRKIVLGNELHPDYKKVLETYMSNFDDVEIEEIDPHPNPPPSRGREEQQGCEGGGAIPSDAACVIVQSPDFFGNVHKYESYRKQCDESGALLIVVVNEIVSLGLLPAPACADIVCGEAQSIGLPMSYGGPHLGFFACQEKYLRQMPGRLCGMTEDADGKRGFVLTLSTREQHIRRDKATSNICTNQGLCALAFTVHMSLLGENGFKRLARLNHEAAIKLAGKIGKVKGVKLLNESFFNEILIEVPVEAKALIEHLAAKGIIAGYAAAQNRLLLAATEMTQEQDIEVLCAEMEKYFA